MLEEFRLHIELRTADLRRTGLTEEQAARHARLEFGQIDSHRVDARRSRGLMFFDQLRFSALDVKLGVRMLVKHRGLSLVSVVSLAVAIAMSAGAFSLIESLLETRLPLPEGDRIVALRNTNVAEPGQNNAPLRDFMTWQSEPQHRPRHRPVHGCRRDAGRLSFSGLRPQMLPYSRAFFGIDDPKAVWQAYVFRMLLSLLVVVVAVNVAILVYARTATRVGEIAVRTTLGASRTRMVTQLFSE